MVTKKNKKKVLIFIVAYNAEQTIKSVLKRIPISLKNKFKVEILVIDDASEDDTFQIALVIKEKAIIKFPLHVLKNPINQGYGGNQKIGYHYAIKNQFDFVALLHGDGQYAPEYLPNLLEPLNKEDADAVFGSRMKSALKGGMPLYKFFGNKILSRIQNIFLNVNLSEFHSGYRIYSVKTLKNIPFFMNTNDFHFDTEIIIQYLLINARIKEIPIPTYYGDEICHVNGLKYAYNVLKTTFTARLQRFNLLYDRRFDVFSKDQEQSIYSTKLDWKVLHFLIREHTKSSRNILDLGCASLEVNDFISKGRKNNIIAVNKLKPKKLPKNIKFFQHDLDMEILSTSFINEKFDTILLLDVVENIENPEKFIDSVYQISKKNLSTKILVSTGNVAFILTRLLHLFGFFNYSKKGILNITHSRLFTFSAIRRLFEQSGFIVEEIKGVPAPWFLFLGDNFLSYFVISINKILNRILPGVFAYKIWIVAKPAPSLDYLLKDAEKNK